MKKIILFLMIGLNTFALSVNISASLQTARYAEASGVVDLVTGKVESKSYVSPIYVINMEVIQDFDYGEIGIGASYEQGYERQNGEESFNAIPIYGIGRIKMGPIFFNAKYGTTLYTGVSDGTKYSNAQYLQAGLGIISDNNITLEGTVNANMAKRNGVNVGTLTYGLTVGVNFD